MIGGWICFSDISGVLSKQAFSLVVQPPFVLAGQLAVLHCGSIFYVKGRSVSHQCLFQELNKWTMSRFALLVFNRNKEKKQIQPKKVERLCEKRKERT
jgi:hypothetical protein